MACVCLYFQVHQPFRLRRYSIFDTGAAYFDDARNAEILRKVAEKCYRPATRLLLDLARRHEGTFRVSFSLSGTVIDQLEAYAPDVITLFRDLCGTGCCEILSETYHHSLASVYAPAEFEEQVHLHSAKVHALFGQRPTVFRNTELVYSNDIAARVASMKDDQGRPRFVGMLAEGIDSLLSFRTPNRVYTPPPGTQGPILGRDGRPFGLLLKNHRLSDDIAFRFSNRTWSEWPLTPDKYARWLRETENEGQVCNLFMDYETFGEHQWAQTGIFEFLASLPDKFLSADPRRHRFVTPAQAVREFVPAGVYDAPNITSWADTERDLSAWAGNAMQANALEEFFKLEAPIKELLARAAGEEQRAAAQELLQDWRRLSTSDHFYYMCTKYFADGQVHAYFNPYESPYDSFINFMNVLDSFRTRVAKF